jgi:molybdopterin synthase catalytic subunit
VESVFYETYADLAPGVLENIEKDSRDRFRIAGVSIMHRFGKIPVGEITYAIAVSALRHEDAFQACRFMVDGLNSDLPVWKYEMPERDKSKT